jgi:hypothetical protein
MTFTPLQGVSTVVKRFLHEQSDKIIGSYPAHEPEARTRGIPTLGSGRIFPVSEQKSQSIL